MMNCIIIDDEPLALAQLTAYVNRIPFLHLTRACHDAYEAMGAMAQEKIDLLFIDINMPDLNGLDFIRSLATKPFVIFTTAYSEYAIEGFKLDAIDYLLKPFEFQDCLKAAEKARKMYEYTHTPATASKEENPDTLFVKSEYKMVRINLQEIKYIEGMSEYIRIYIDDKDKPIVTLNSLQKLEERLPEYFMRVHRSYIVNMRKVTEISRLRIIFDKDTYIPIGENYKDKFIETINRQSII